MYYFFLAIIIVTIFRIFQSLMLKNNMGYIFFNKKTAAILDLCLKDWSNYMKDTINEFLDLKLHRNDKSHIII